MLEEERSIGESEDEENRVENVCVFLAHSFEGGCVLDFEIEVALVSLLSPE